MKKIEAIIQPFRLEAVKTALNEAGAGGMTVTDVLGMGRQRGHTEVYRGNEYQASLLPHIKVELVVHDRDCEDVIQAIRRGACTGKLGDGKIFVFNVPAAVRIRNDQQDEAAL